jgi:AcrR family transcriptional regulator
MAGLRERKRARTVAAIHDAGMRLFAERGYNDVTVSEIAEAADVSRATVFAYFRAKEDIVLGDGPAAIEGLRTMLADPTRDAPVIATVRAWLRAATGWIEPGVVLQRRLADEIPAVGAARSRLLRDVQGVIAEALAIELGEASPRKAGLVAGALGSALEVVEAEAAARYEQGAAAPGPEEIDALLDTAVRFVDAGLAGLHDRDPAPARP